MKNTLRFSLCAASMVVGLASISQVHSAVLAQYTLNTTNELVATSVNANLGASSLSIRQSKDPNGGALDNDTYQFTSTGLLINRSTTASLGWDHGTNVVAPFFFTISANNGRDIQVDSVTFAAGASPTGHVLAVRFGSSETTGGYPASAGTIGQGGGSTTSALPSPFTITAGGSKTFFVDLNSNNGNSTHKDLSFTVNGTAIPEPSAALLGGLGMLLLLRRRRN